MASTLYDYCRVPMDDIWKKDGDKRCKLLLGIGILMLLIIVILGVPLIIFTIKANSEACRDGLRAVMECRNVTHLLQQELTEAQKGFQDVEAQAATCNHTVKRKPGLKRENRRQEVLLQLPGLQLRCSAPAPDCAAGPQRSAAVRSQEAGTSWKVRPARLFA
ncbi:bone marrow stromal antigen 2 isoform X2 [Pan troglodytes]|uniref:bone marrow stromal antigen 2 isoform X2 n=1 Tax=Pan troglodytes TaxID=9598 RepID=UPI0030136DF9